MILIKFGNYHFTSFVLRFIKLVDDFITFIETQ